MARFLNIIPTVLLSLLLVVYLSLHTWFVGGHMGSVSLHPELRPFM